MLIKQISIFVENKSGRLAEITKLLGSKNIDISALSIADTTDFGILRLIVNDPEKAEKTLKDSGFTVSSTDVVAIAIEDKPGGLAKVLDILSNNSIGIEYMYAFVGKDGAHALLILRVENPDKAVGVLQKAKIRTLSSKEVYGL